MTAPARVIVLAAGEGLQLDGFNKLLLRHPATGERVLDLYLRLFAGLPLTVVVGYRAVEVMHEYPQLHYVHNRDWRLTNNSYSLGLALDERPCVVLSSDMFLAPELASRVVEASGDVVLTEARENRTLSALQGSLGDGGRVLQIYQGAIRSPRDPEVVGVFKVATPRLLAAWRRRCLEHGNLFAGLNLPLEEHPVHAVDAAPFRVDEVNSPDDYLRLLAATREPTP